MQAIINEFQSNNIDCHQNYHEQDDQPQHMVPQQSKQYSNHNFTPLFGQYSRSLIIHDDTNILSHSHNPHRTVNHHPNHNSHDNNSRSGMKKKYSSSRAGHSNKIPVGTKSYLINDAASDHNFHSNIDIINDTMNTMKLNDTNNRRLRGRKKKSARHNDTNSHIPAIRIKQREPNTVITDINNHNGTDDEIVFQPRNVNNINSNSNATNTPNKPVLDYSIPTEPSLPITVPIHGNNDLLASAIKSYEKQSKPYKKSNNNSNNTAINNNTNNTTKPVYAKKNSSSNTIKQILQSDNRHNNNNNHTPFKQYVAKSPRTHESESSIAIVIEPYTINAQLPLILLDAANIAMNYGSNKVFDCTGIELVYKYYSSCQHRIIMFLPEYNLDAEFIRRKTYYKNNGDTTVRATHLPNNLQLLHAYKSAGILYTTAAQDYDDDYLIQYCKLHQPAYIVTNDQYRDSMEQIRNIWQNNNTSTTDNSSNNVNRQSHKTFLDQHLITYTFVNHEFLPNPKMNYVSNVSSAG